MTSLQRPFVFINMAVTVDGKITSTRREYPGFTAPADRERMDRLRASADALMVAAGTVRADNPAWHIRTATIREKTGAPSPHRVLVSAAADIPEESRFFDDSHGGDSILATVEEAPEAHLRRFEGRAEIWKHGRDRVDLERVLFALRERGVERLLVEGGGELNWSMLALDLVDEIYLTISPALLGGRDAPTFLGGDGWPMKQQRRLRLLELDRVDDELYCRYSVET